MLDDWETRVHTGSVAEQHLWPVFLSVCLDVRLYVRIYMYVYMDSRHTLLSAHRLFFLGTYMQSCWIFLSWNSLLMFYKLQLLDMFVIVTKLFVHLLHANICQYFSTVAAIIELNYCFQLTLSPLGDTSILFLNSLSLHYRFWILLGFFSFDSLKSALPSSFPILGLTPDSRPLAREGGGVRPR